ncbi:MAG: hypothetical protein HFJ08_17295 [Lachnospiraceae bacterium]|jgi:hypothetical protein|nr:hypothetical protein [Lachnospiraceae bacterium]MCI9400078.1 hypothetical protein [Lachnospiraceae bacterium]MCX4377856.1 hypothetical protein [Lachnospiraceae bacterium]
MSSGQGEIPDRRLKSAGAKAQDLVKFQNRQLFCAYANTEEMHGTLAAHEQEDKSSLSII